MAALCAAAFLPMGCNTTATPIVDARTLTFDVPKCLFGAPDAVNPGDRGPGIDTVTVTIAIKGAAAVTQSFAAGSFGGGDFASFTADVTGQMESIAVSGTAAGAEVVSLAAVSDFSAAEVVRYAGYTLFANVKNFKVDWTGGDKDTGVLRLLPCPRSSAKLLVDSGAQAPGAGLTDRKASVKTLQAAVQVVVAESAAAADIDYTVYYGVSDNDPSLDFNSAYWTGTYLKHPWTAQWTYAEVTSTSGKPIGDKTYMLKASAAGKQTGITADGVPSILIDLANDAKVGQYLLYCAVLTRGGISVPTDVGVVKIN
jgi:hypothetical protein